MTPDENITVCSRLSPPGVGGVAVIQIVGPRARELASQFLRRRHSLAAPELPGDELRLVRWFDGDEHLDDVIAVAVGCDAPQPGLCLTTHGGVRVVERILMCLQRAGARIVQDLPLEQIWSGLSPLEAALLTHLPLAQTRRAALWLTEQVQPLRDAVEACVRDLQRGQAPRAREQLLRLAATYQSARILLEGATVAIVGPPNAGKSTLANRLFDKPWSIESDQPGTTRDWVEQRIAINGVPILLVDTAGLRRCDDPLETAGIRQSADLIRNAHVQVAVLDAGREDSAIDREWLSDLLQAEKLVVVLNKSDLGVQVIVRRRAEQLGADRPLMISALKGTGLRELRQSILGRLRLDDPKWPSPCVWDPRHRDVLLAATEEALQDPSAAVRLLSLTFGGSG